MSDIPHVTYLRHRRGCEKCYFGQVGRSTLRDYLYFNCEDPPTLTAMCEKKQLTHLSQFHTGAADEQFASTVQANAATWHAPKSS